MPSKALKTLEVESCDDWRHWLARHHNVESEIWLVFYKRQSGRPSLAYPDALDEALCFGWIDSLIKRLDDARYARKFTPRKPDSKWSTANRQRYAQLQASGRVMPPGLNRAPTARGYPARPAPPSTIPQYIDDALNARPTARKYFDGLPASHRRRYVGWIDSAKRQETKMKRLQEAIGLLAEGRKLGLK
jgi:uncharacterized protein YdeI (YjbR/CyaY-like superfamily)